MNLHVQSLRRLLQEGKQFYKVIVISEKQSALDHKIAETSEEKAEPTDRGMSQIVSETPHAGGGRGDSSVSIA